MQAPFEMTEGLSRLQAIVAEFPPESAHWNEAQNRFQFIDRLLTQCLGWQHPHIKVEEPDGVGGRIDYVLGTPAKAILEAKREAALFETLPVGIPSTVRKISPLLKASKAFEQAVHQVIPYCALQGAQIAVVCNGPQLALFQAILPGGSPLEGECFLFNGTAQYIEHFTLLWTLLSPEGITENRACRTLALHRNPRVPPKASEVIPEPTRYRYRNSFQENLRVLSSLLLEEVEENTELKHSFYQECYVSVEANNRHLLLSKQIIAARYRRVADDASITPLALGSPKDQGKRFSGDAIGAAGARPIVVIGDVGVGKTSFFENLYDKISEQDRKDTYFIHINLGVRASLSKDVKTVVLDVIPDVLRTQYDVDIDDAQFVNSIYHGDLQRFDRGVSGGLKDIDPSAYQRARIAFLESKVAQRDSHLLAALAHLAHGRQKQIILVIDNADQRSFEIQQEAFLIAQELASSRSVIVFVALRPSTFYQSKTTGALSGYQNRILTISPPPADEVILKRLTFAVRVAEGKVGHGTLSGIRFRLGNVVSFLNATLRSIRVGDDIRQFLKNITGGNTRAVIELITGFCGSPNVDSEKIVSIEETQGNYRVPLHEFAKHALLGDYAYFNAHSSLVACNIYDVSTSDCREHFLSGLIIGFLGSSSGIRDNDGFVSGEAILREMVKYGFVEDQVRNSLRRLASKRLIETPHAHYREVAVPEHEPPEQFYFRSTSIGMYHIRYWAGSFSFLDAVSTDTPIFDEEVRADVMDVAASFDISDRLNRTLRFRQYLEEQWHAANVANTYFDPIELFRSQEQSFESVRFAVSRPKGTTTRARR